MATEPRLLTDAERIHDAHAACVVCSTPVVDAAFGMMLLESPLCAPCASLVSFATRLDVTH